MTTFKAVVLEGPARIVEADRNADRVLEGLPVKNTSNLNLDRGDLALAALDGDGGDPVSEGIR